MVAYIGYDKGETNMIGSKSRIFKGNTMCEVLVDVPECSILLYQCIPSDDPINKTVHLPIYLSPKPPTCRVDIPRAIDFPQEQHSVFQ